MNDPIFDLPDFQRHFQIQVTTLNYIDIKNAESLTFVYFCNNVPKILTANHTSVLNCGRLCIILPDTACQLCFSTLDSSENILCIIQISTTLAGRLFSLSNIHLQPAADNSGHSRLHLKALEGICRSIASDVMRNGASQNIFCSIKDEASYRIKNYMYLFRLADALYPLILFPEHTLPQKAPAPLANILSYIRQNWGTNISLHELAKHAGMSDASLSRAIKKYTGDNFEVYLKKIRLHAAARDLILTSRLVTDIAIDHGFSSAPALNKAFREFYKLTPGQYRRQFKESAANAGNVPESLPNPCLNSVAHTALSKQPIAYPAYEGFTAELTLIANAKPERLARNSRIFTCSGASGVSSSPHAPWLMAVNMGMASDFKHGRFQKLFSSLARHSHFRYARIYNIFSPEMDFRSGHDCNTLNFSQLDEIFDLILEHGMLPMIELATKPRIVKKNIYETVLFEDIDPVFLSDKEEIAVMEHFFTHLKSKYAAAAQQWLFEYWYDYTHTSDPDGEIYPFIKKFEKIASLLKKLLPCANIGGFGLPLINFDMEQIIKTLANQPTPPDFLSFSYFPYSGRDLGYSPHWMTSWITGTSHINNECSRMKELCRKYFSHELPVYITEWNMSLSNRNYFNDSCEKAALLVHYMLSLSKQVDMIAYYMGCDFTVRTYDTSLALSGASGLMTRDGIFKPVHYALNFLVPQQGSRQLLRQDGFLILASGQDFTITGSHPGRFISTGYLTPDISGDSEHEITENTLEEIFEPAAGQNVSITIKNVSPGSYLLTRHSLSREHGNLPGEWKQLKLLEPLEEKLVAYLKDICQPHITTKIIHSNHTELQLNEYVDVHETLYLELKYLL